MRNVPRLLVSILVLDRRFCLVLDRRFCLHRGSVAWLCPVVVTSQVWADSEGGRLRGLCAMVIRHSRRSAFARTQNAKLVIFK